MPWVQLLVPVIRFFFTWLGNRTDPKNVRLRDIANIKSLKEKDVENLEEALANSDTVALSLLLQKTKRKYDSRKRNEKKKKKVKK